jgi:hypothetical protein
MLMAVVFEIVMKRKQKITVLYQLTFTFIVQKLFAVILYLLITFLCFSPQLSTLNGSSHEVYVYNSYSGKVNIAVSQ